MFGFLKSSKKVDTNLHKSTWFSEKTFPRSLSLDLYGFPIV